MGREKGENKGCGGLGPERVCGVGGGVVGVPVYPWEAGLMWFGRGLCRAGTINRNIG